MKTPSHSLRFFLVPLFAMAMIALIAARREPSHPAPLPQQAPPLHGQALTSAGVTALHAIANSANNADLRWPNFAPYKAEFAKFYDGNGSSLAWVQNGHVRSQGLILVVLPTTYS